MEGKIREAPRLNLTKRCLHYQNYHDVPEDLRKYFSQRYSLFSLYDDGIRMTHDAWFGVTPEPVANQIAQDLGWAADQSKTAVVDLFAGAGGNTIAFALSGRWKRVVAVEKDADALACAQHNAEVYGCGRGGSTPITWVQADCFDFLEQQQQQQSLLPLPSKLRIAPNDTVVFASPPWGGISYRDHEVFDLETMRPYNLSALHGAFMPYDHLLYLPRTSDLRQIAALAPEGEKIEVVQYCTMGASKAMVAYIPGTAGVQSGKQENKS